MNPNPLASLNHFTVPVRIEATSTLVERMQRRRPQRLSTSPSPPATDVNKYNNQLTKKCNTLHAAGAAQGCGPICQRIVSNSAMIAGTCEVAAARLAKISGRLIG